MIALTKHQEEAFQKLQAALEEGQSPVVLAGAAGTGKTTLMGQMMDRFNSPLFLAPTNRAALVLRSKMPAGAWVSTIHAAVARVSHVTHEKAIDYLQALIRMANKQERDVCQVVEAHVARTADSIPNLDLSAMQTDSSESMRRSLCRLLRQAERDNEIIFKQSGGPARAAGCIVVDEASMVTLELLGYITEGFPNVPVVLVGDRYQLPPVVNGSDKATGGVLDRLEPTAQLDEVMRQAEESTILAFATWVRRANPKRGLRTCQLAGNKRADLSFVRRPKSGITKGLLRELDETVDVVLCRRNDTRRAINRGLRALSQTDRDDWLPYPGERLVFVNAPSRTALDDGRALDPVTGEAPDPQGSLCQAVKGTFMVASLVDLVPDKRGYLFVRLTGQIDGTEKPVTLHVAAGEFLKTYQQDEGNRFGFQPRGWFALDYGRCLSVHKAQGSEFDRVAVYEQSAPHTPRENGTGWLRPSSEEHRRWCYTAATRAKKSLLWVCKPL